MVGDKVQVVLYPLPGACCIKRSYDQRALKYCSGTTTNCFKSILGSAINSDALCDPAQVFSRSERGT